MRPHPSSRYAYDVDLRVWARVAEGASLHSDFATTVPSSGVGAGELSALQARRVDGGRNKFLPKSLNLKP